MSKNKYPCTVSKDLWDTWRKVARHGDIADLEKFCEVSRPTIRRAINNGYVVQNDLPDKINRFFYERLVREKAEAERLIALADEVKALQSKTKRKPKSFTEKS
jgi:hypothetical protein